MHARTPTSGDGDDESPEFGDQPQPRGPRPSLSPNSWREIQAIWSNAQPELAALLTQLVTTLDRLGAPDERDEVLDLIVSRVIGKSPVDARADLEKAIEHLEPQPNTASCTHHCDVFRAIIGATIPQEKHDAFRTHTLECAGDYTLWISAGDGQPERYGVSLAACPTCDAPRFTIVKFRPSPVRIPPLTNAGVFFRFGNKLNIQMFENYRQETFVFVVPPDPRGTRHPYVGILLDVTGAAAAVDAKKALMVKTNTPAAQGMTRARFMNFLADPQTEVPGILRATDNFNI